MDYNTSIYNMCTKSIRNVIKVILIWVYLHEVLTIMSAQPSIPPRHSH